MKFEEKVVRFIQKYHMFTSGQGILIGLSGGADSVALLEVLCALRSTWDLNLAALHVHHGIRKEAQEDADFCERLCKEKQVPYYCEYVNVPKAAEQSKLTLEEAGRKIRYALFEQYRQKLQLDVIAVAHHQNDQAETMLFQLFRGSGLKGAAGIPVKRDHIVRPLLAVSRQQIEQYLQEKQCLFVTDATNLMDIYTRNKIRQHILPMAEEISLGAVEHMNAASEQFREVCDFMQQQADAFLNHYGTKVPKEHKLTIPLEAFGSLHIALQKMVIMTAIEQTLESRKDITQKHIEAILELCGKDGEKSVRLPKGGLAVKQYQTLVFCTAQAPKAGQHMLFEPFELLLDQTYVLQNGDEITTSLIFDKNLENIPKNDCTKWFDYDKIKSTLVLRYREQGDFLTINDRGSTKKLQDYLVNEKVPKSERDQMLVLADGHHIVWVLGKRISTYYKVTEETKQILSISFRRK